MKAKLLLAAIGAIMLLNSIPSGWTDSSVPPVPGQIRVDNGLRLENGTCVGNLSVAHAPLATDAVGRIVLTVETDCGVAVGWQKLTPTVTRGVYSIRNVSANYSTPSGAFLALAGTYNKPTAGSECPGPLAAFRAQSVEFFPGRARDSSGNPSPSDSGLTSFTASSADGCYASWTQYWQTYGPDPAHPKLVTLAKRIHGNALATPYNDYDCDLNRRIMPADRLTCWERTNSLKAPGEPGSSHAWGEEQSIAKVDPDSVGVVELPPLM